MLFMPYNLGCSFYFDKKRALATGISTSGAGVGYIVMPFLASIVYKLMGWRKVFMVFAGFNTAAFLASFLYRPLQSQDDDDSEEHSDKSDILYIPEFFQSPN